MTKEIIIDGVNVVECDYAILPEKQCPAKAMPYAKETSCIACKEHNTKLNFCKNNPSCYFKQLQRLKQENEELKEKIKSEKYIKENALQEATKYSMKCGEFKQTLEEIKEISKQCMTKDLCSIDCDYADRCYIEDAEVPTYDICKLIIEIINEVLNDRD